MENSSISILVTFFVFAFSSTTCTFLTVGAMVGILTVLVMVGILTVEAIIGILTVSVMVGILAIGVIVGISNCSCWIYCFYFIWNC